MAFNKVVKAPAKLAHIKNCPRKKSEARDRRVKWLLGYIRSLLEVVLINKADVKMNFYEQLRATEQELKDLGCYDKTAIHHMVIEAKFEHGRYHRW